MLPLLPLISDYNIQKGSETPVGGDFMDIDPESPKVDSKVFASGVMSLYYLALRVRRDILFAVTYLSMRIQDAREKDMKKLMKIFRYIYATRDYHVILRCKGTTLVFYVDASYAIHHNARSHTGFYFTLSEGDVPRDGFNSPIFGKSLVQKLVSLSSFEAELNAVHQIVQFFYLLRQFLQEIGFDQSLPSLLLQDNQATIHVMNHGPSQQSRSRHLNVRIWNLKQLVDTKMIKIIYVPTDEMLADALTKPYSARSSMIVLKRLLNMLC